MAGASYSPRPVCLEVLWINKTVLERWAYLHSKWYSKRFTQDGLALVDSMMNVIQFLSYEGSFTATSGLANGMTSKEHRGIRAKWCNSNVGYSLQLDRNRDLCMRTSHGPRPCLIRLAQSIQGQTFTGGCSTTRPRTFHAFSLSLPG